MVSASVLPAREAAYYKVVVPSNTPSWKVKLAPSSGDVLLCALKDYVPQNDAYNSSLVTQPQSYPQGKKMQKPGNEHLALFPDYAQTEIPAGTYFLAVVSEGQNPDSNLSRIGTGTADYTLATVGVVPLVDLGTVSNADLWITNALEGGEIATYQFTTADGVPNLEVRLEDKIGNPSLTLRSDDQTPSVGNLVNNSGQSYYGNQGGQTPGWQSYSIISVPNPSVARFTATIFAYTDNPFGYSFTFPNAAYKLRVHPPTIALLNFSSNLNTNGSTNAASAQLADNQRAFFQVVVPETIAGAPVLGWKLDLFQNSGSPSFRVRKDLLPTDTNPSSQTFFITGSGLIAPPYLTPGSWFVEIKGSGNTDFTLVSSALTINELQRPIWSMPGEGQSLSSSNLVMPVFGDTAVAGDGSLLPGDGGTDLQAGRFDYYAVSVPTNNVGLLRTELQAISGNPNLYLRAGAAPTPSHYAQGQAGATLYDHSLTGSGNTKYGNWVPLDGRFERHLTNGLWLVAVQAGGTANARYRLKVSCGNVTPNALVQSIALDGLSVANQSLAGRDWRYYRFMVPSNPPASINLSFSRSLGNARVFLRDTVPPGDGSIPYDYDFYSSSHYERSWYSDSKNQGPYPRFDTPGSYSLPTPPLRPGAAYYLGVWSFNDTTFSLSLSTDTNVIVISNRLGFYGGTVSDSLPAFGARLYDIDVPPDATRLQLYATNSASVIFTLEQGTLPQVSGGAHWRSSGANVSLNQPLSLSFWPWQPDQSYYLLVTNSSASSQPFALFSEGRNTFTEQTPGILRVTAIQAGVISEVEFVGEPLRVYRLLFSSNLADWMMFTNVSSLTGTSRVSTATAPQTGSGFYRTVTP
ncbi:MAG: hypothetical protein C5B50_12020 [Verrucomicrobia bacterium]|nr:MAG: hypothetical protein C5B50_12020 [Verrucomicrobiota bacterium]